MNLILNINQARFLIDLLEPYRYSTDRQLRRLVEKADRLKAEIRECDHRLELVKSALRQGVELPFVLTHEDGCLTTTTPEPKLTPEQKKHFNSKSIMASLINLEYKLKNGYKTQIFKATDGKIEYTIWKDAPATLRFWFDPAEIDGLHALREINHKAPAEAF